MVNVVDVINGLVGIVWVFTGGKKMNFTCRAWVEGESGRKKLGSGRKRQWRGQIRKEGRKNRS